MTGAVVAHVSYLDLFLNRMCTIGHHYAMLSSIDFIHIPYKKGIQKAVLHIIVFIILMFSCKQAAQISFHCDAHIEHNKWILSQRLLPGPDSVSLLV